jgi:tRNA-specific 2-thiouridylase
MRVRIKVRHRHEPALATIEKSGADEVTATFDEPVRAVTPGQAAVFYQGDVVVGGGWIAADHRRLASGTGQVTLPHPPPPPAVREGSL